MLIINNIQKSTKQYRKIQMYELVVLCDTHTHTRMSGISGTKQPLVPLFNLMNPLLLIFFFLNVLVYILYTYTHAYMYFPFPNKKKMNN